MAGEISFESAIYGPPRWCSGTFTIPARQEGLGDSGGTDARRRSVVFSCHGKDCCHRNLSYRSRPRLSRGRGPSRAPAAALARSSCAPGAWSMLSLPPRAVRRSREASSWTSRGGQEQQGAGVNLRQKVAIEINFGLANASKQHLQGAALRAAIRPRTCRPAPARYRIGAGGRYSSETEAGEKGGRASRKTSRIAVWFPRWAIPHV